MPKQDSSLLPSDEGLNHQIAETFATVVQSDRDWTEKVWGSIFKKDGSLAVGFGLGKYINRNVMDAYAGVSRGVEQWTVRGSRMLFPDPDRSSVGPIHYEIIEPLRRLRVRLEENDTQPIAFDITMSGHELPPFMENHEFRRQVFGFRVETDLCRYHQVGVAEGWLKIDGERVDIDPREWCASRDHSWGVRYEVGVKPSDLMPGIRTADLPVHILWSPMLFHDGDGSPYSIHHFYADVRIPNYDAFFHGGVEYPDGTRTPFTALRPELIYHNENRRLLGGQLHFTEENGEIRTLEIEPLGDTGFHLGAGLYFGYKGSHHGSWRGKLNVEGEHIADCSESAVARELHQLRDCVVRVKDGENVGYAIYQTIINGEWPEYDLDGESSFL